MAGCFVLVDQTQVGANGWSDPKPILKRIGFKFTIIHSLWIFCGTNHGHLLRAKKKNRKRQKGKPGLQLHLDFPAVFGIAFVRDIRIVASCAGEK